MAFHAPGHGELARYRSGWTSLGGRAVTKAVDALSGAGTGGIDGAYVARVQRRTIRTVLVSQLFGSVGVSVAFAVSALAATALARSTTRAGIAQGSPRSARSPPLSPWRR